MKPFRFIGAAYGGAGWGVARKTRIVHPEWSGKVKSVCHLLLSGKLQNGTISLSAMPINRRCGLLFGKVSPPFRLSFIGCPLKRENGRHEMWPNVFFKPLRALEYGEFY